MKTAAKPRPQIPPHKDGATGWPRPRGTWDKPYDDAHEPKPLPVPWITHVSEREGVVWTMFHDHASKAHTERLRQVCGEQLSRRLVLCRAHQDGDTPGPACHPRCAALAVRFCPHLAQHAGDEIIAYLYVGDGVGYEFEIYSPDPDALDGLYENPHQVVAEAEPLTRSQLVVLATEDPLGEGA